MNTGYWETLSPCMNAETVGKDGLDAGKKLGDDSLAPKLADDDEEVDGVDDDDEEEDNGADEEEKKAGNELEESS